MAPREAENNAYAKFWGDKQRVLWYVMVFSGVVNFVSLSRENARGRGFPRLVLPSPFARVITISTK